jgi:8-oxo-dGTP pyrophosphatase MutT (NUDIX family)
LKESYLKAATRELYEETNIKINKQELRFFFHLDFTMPSTHRFLQDAHPFTKIKNLFCLFA